MLKTAAAARRSFADFDLFFFDSARRFLVSESNCLERFIDNEVCFTLF